MTRLPLVLAIEPDLRQAAIVKRVVKERVQADVVVVDSRDAAIAAINAAIPDVVLVSMLLSPRDEDDLIAHLRTLEGGAHLQTHTIPQLASALGPGEDGGRGGLFSAFRRKKQATSAPAGCDPDLFADEIRVYLQRAAEKKREAAETGSVTALPSLARRPQEAPAAAEQPPSPAAGSSWASPFEWRPSSDRRVTLPPIEETVKAESPIPDPPSPILDPQSPIPNLASLMADPEPLVAEPAPVVASPEPVIADPEPLIPVPPPPAPVHTPAPFSVWAKTESPKGEDRAADAEFAALFARLGVPDGVAAVAYADGVRIRRVRVRAAKEANPSLHGAMLLGKRMLAELNGSDVRA